MNFQLMLNDTVLQEGDLKTLSALFNDLSGLSFAKGQASKWLEKMSATESYDTYLRIKAAEFGVSQWHGALVLCDRDGQAERVHFFDTHSETLTQKKNLKNSR